MTQIQKEMVECALRVLMKTSPVRWGELSSDLRRCLEKYMDKDVWTGECDVASLREAAVLILRDAITRSGQFAECGS